MWTTPYHWKNAIHNERFIIAGVVYLGGHGFYSGGQHYFSPVDPHEGHNLAEHYCIETIQKELLEKNPKSLTMFLDICRT